MRLGLERAGHDCAWSCEIDPFARRVYGTRFAERAGALSEPEAGDVSLVKPGDVPPADLWIGGAPCFPPGTLVLTSEGACPIEDVKTGDMVLTHQGRYRRVLRAGSRFYQGPLVVNTTRRVETADRQENIPQAAATATNSRSAPSAPSSSTGRKSNLPARRPRRCSR